MYESSIPAELMSILTDINNNLAQVKERLASLEAKDHAKSIERLENAIEKEHNARIALEIELASVKTKLAPIVVGLSMAGAIIMEALFKTFS